MVTAVGTESNLVDLFNDLVRLDYDAIAAYQAAVDRLDNPDYPRTLRSFRDDHERHTRDLKPFVRELGGDPPNEAGPKSLLTSGKVAIAGLVGDKAILRAMLSNEEDTNTAYERATRHDGLTASMKRVLEANLKDERRHRDWIESTLENM